MDTQAYHDARRDLQAMRKIVTPLLAADTILEAAIEAAGTVEEAQRALKAAQRDKHAVTEETARLTAEMQALRQQAAEETLAIGNEMAALREKLAAERNQAQADMNQARQAAALVIASAEADAAQRTAQLVAQVDALLKEKTEVEQALAALRARFA